MILITPFIGMLIEWNMEIDLPKWMLQFDIDSDKINPFTIEDELLLEACCDLISKTYGSSLLSL